MDTDDAPGKVSADIGILGEVMFHAIEVRIIKTETVGSGRIERSVRRKKNATLHTSIDQDLYIFKALVVTAKTGTSDAFGSERHRAALRKRLRPDLLVEELIRPHRRILASRRREVRKVEEAVLGKVGIQSN